jgi:acyl transferase domain-containing protein
MDTACKALANGDCELAVVGGTNLTLSPGLSCILAAEGVNSPDGRCHSFDANASGYGRAEAVSSLVIKRLDFALRDGNPIRGVIRSSLCNADGKTPGITQPNPEAHEALIRAAYAAAGIPEEKYSQTAFFECHGTGTIIGDPIEASAVARVFGRDGMIIGSVSCLLPRHSNVRWHVQGQIQYWTFWSREWQHLDNQSNTGIGTSHYSAKCQLWQSKSQK